METKRRTRKVITFQSQQVIDSLMKESIYYPTEIVDSNHELPRKLLKSITGFDHLVFGLDVTKQGNAWGAAGDILLIMNVPEEFVFDTDYYAWGDLIHYLEEWNPIIHENVPIADMINSASFTNKKDYDEYINLIALLKSKSNICTTQLLLPYINRQWIVDVIYTHDSERLELDVLWELLSGTIMTPVDEAPILSRY